MTEMLTNSDGGPCFICKEHCNTIDFSFETLVHDGECLRRLWNEYVEASMARDEECRDD